MIDILKNVPDHIAGFRVYGKVTADDYEKVVIPHTETKLAQAGVINFLLVVDTDLGNFTFGAWLNDAFLGIKHLSKWRRAAILTNNDSANAFTDAFSKIAPGEFKGFRLNELEAAVRWISAREI